MRKIKPRPKVMRRVLSAVRCFASSAFHEYLKETYLAMLSVYVCFLAVFSKSQNYRRIALYISERQFFQQWPTCPMHL